jgi:hypothetical protein
MEISSLFDISVIVAVFGAMILYFGKIMCDINVGFHEKLDYSIPGLIFVLVWVILPSVAAYTIYMQTISTLKTLNIMSLINPIVLIIAVLLLICGKKHIDLNKKGKISKDSKDFFIKYVGNDIVLFLYACIAFLITFYDYSFIEIDLMNFVFSIIGTIFILTLSAMISAYNKIKEYPNVRFFLQDGSSVDGIVIKYADFIKVLENRKKEVKINKNVILKIEKL